MSSKLKSFIIASSFGIISAQAQLFPTTGDKQIVLGMNGNTAIIQYRQFTSETMNNRFGATLSYGFNDNDNESNGLHNTTKNSNYAVGFSFGRQMNFKVGEKLSPYVALDANVGLSYNNYSNQITLVDSAVYNNSRSFSNRTVLYNNFSETKATYINLGLSPVIGFNYYLAKNFALGAECSVNIVNFNYAINADNHTHSQSTSLQVTTNRDGVTGAYLPNTYENVKDYDRDNKFKNKSLYNLNGSIYPSIKITAVFYIK